MAIIEIKQKSKIVVINTKKEDLTIKEDFAIKI